MILQEDIERIDADITIKMTPPEPEALKKLTKNSILRSISLQQ
jgi:hypothetical protein